MKTGFRALLRTVVFWLLLLGIAGLAMVVHGDCGAGATRAEAATCVHQKEWLGFIVLAIGAVVYAVGTWRISKRRRNRDSPD
jgi:membrane protein implicated in regulation of membrane protease activity